MWSKQTKISPIFEQVIDVFLLSKDRQPSILRGQAVYLPIPMVLAWIGLTIGEMIPRFPMGADQYRSLRFDNTVDENDVTAFDQRPDDLRTLTDYLTPEPSA